MIKPKRYQAMSLLFPLVFLLLFSSNAASSTAISLSGNDQPISLTPHFDYVVFASSINQAELQQQLNQSRWQPYNQETHSKTIYQHGIWLRFTLSNTHPEALTKVLKLHWPNFSDIQFYSQTQQGQLQQLAKVENGHFSGQQIDRFPHAFSFTVAAKSEQDFYLYLRSYDKNLASATLYSDADFEQTKLIRNLAYGLFFGVLLAMLGYNFCLFIFLKGPTTSCIAFTLRPLSPIS